jgi:hypothetical protein
MREQCSRSVLRSIHRAITGTLAISLTFLAAPILAATAPDDAETLRCESTRRELDRDLLAALANCRRRGAEAEARRMFFPEATCERRARAALPSALVAAGCSVRDGSSGLEGIASAAFGATERAVVDLPSGVREVAFTRASGQAVFEGDIVLGKAVDDPEPAPRRDDLAATAGFAVTSMSLIWPSATIPYDIDPPTSPVIRERILAAIDHWSSATLIRFRPRTVEDRDLVMFASLDPACWAELGRQGGVQILNLGPACQRGNAIHEIGHAVGLLHEHTRPDRDRFVTVNWEHVSPSQRFNFEMSPLPLSAGPVQPLAYDVGSLMHYGSFAYSMNGLPTLVRRTGQTFVENREALTTLDVAAVTGLVLARAGTPSTKLSIQSSGRCLLGPRSQRRAGGATRMRGCEERPEARWHVYADPHSGAELLVNGWSRQCLSVPGASTASGVQVRLQPCNGGTEQRLDVAQLPGGGLQVRSAASGLCIGTVDALGVERARVVQAPCNGSAGQVWTQQP